MNSLDTDNVMVKSASDDNEIFDDLSVKYLKEQMQCFFSQV